MGETPSTTWIERLLARLPRRRVPPRLLDGYTQRVMARITPTAPTVRLCWERPVRWALAPAAVVAGVLVWVLAGGRAPLSQRALTQAAVLEHLEEPWHADAIDASLLVDDAQQADRVVLAEVPATAAASAESLATLLHLLDEEPLDPADAETPEDWWPDMADPTTPA